MPRDGIRSLPQVSAVKSASALREAADIALIAALKKLRSGTPQTTAWLQAASALDALRRWDERDAALASAQKDAATATEFTACGDLAVRLGAHAQARSCYDQALLAAPRHNRYRFNRAAVRRFLGDLDGAEQDYDEIIRSGDRDPEAWLNRSELRVQTSTRNHLAELQMRLNEGCDPPIGEVPLRYALAKENEDLGRYHESWRHLAIGAQLRRAHLRYEVKIDTDTAGWISDSFGPPPPPAANDNRQPIFIVGMPRTGSTLLESILGASQQVSAAGELTDFAEAMMSGVAQRIGGAQLERRALIAASADIDAAALGADYLERTRPKRGERAHFTDKMPLNYLYVGLIRRALPQARILHLTRHPMATCYAMFKTLFNRGYPFSYDLSEIADYYIAYWRLMEHWHRVEPGSVLDVSYERLVSSPDEELRHVFEYCSLDWHSRFLDTARDFKNSTTASASQARRPIYSGSVDLWRHYAHGLAPVADRLRRAGIPVD
jgi:tetratricopeptide (TPR) repeat protein